ncbi:hypothetical protein Tco_0468782, partial [Tanacetum coccineum]
VSLVDLIDNSADEEGVGCENDASIQKSNGVATLEKEMETRVRPHLDKDCPLNEEVKQVEEVRYGEFRRTAPFNGSNGGKFYVGPPGYYTKIDNRPPYVERRQSLEELLAKHQEESTQSSIQIEEKSEEAKVVTIENEGPRFPKKLKNLHGISFFSESQEENTID